MMNVKKTCADACRAAIIDDRVDERKTQKSRWVENVGLGSCSCVRALRACVNSVGKLRASTKLRFLQAEKQA